MRNAPHSALTFVSRALLVTCSAGCGGGEPPRTAAPPRVTVAGADAALPPETPVDPAALAVPGLAAAPCTSDAACLNHRCNLPAGKCAFPCASDADCVRGTFCFKAVISTCQAKAPDQP